MSDKKSNNAPYAVLELNEDEARWLTKLLAKSKELADASFLDVSSMSGSDPRARWRASLQMAACVDQNASEGLGERLSRQNAKTRKIWDERGPTALERVIDETAKPQCPLS